MKALLILFLIFNFHACATKNTVVEKPSYGQEITAKSAIPMKKILANYNSYENKDVVMAANVEKVCAKKGCWMTLQGDHEAARVKFHDYSFFVPLSLVGKKVWVEGKVLRKKISIADTKHYLKDAGASAEEIAAVKAPTYEYRIIAKGVKVIK